MIEMERDEETRNRRRMCTYAAIDRIIAAKRAYGQTKWADEAEAHVRRIRENLARKNNKG